MQLRKVCNHPNLFEPRPTVSPFQMEALTYTVPRSVFNIMEYNPFNVRDSIIHFNNNLKTLLTTILCYNRKSI